MWFLIIHLYIDLIIYFIITLKKVYLYLQNLIVANEDSLVSFSDDLSDDLTQVGKIKTKSSKKEKKPKKLDAQVIINIKFLLLTC